MATKVENPVQQARPGGLPLPLAHLIDTVGKVQGVRAMALGGSRVYGTSVPSSDFDVMVFSDREPDLDHAAMKELVVSLGGKMTTHRRSPNDSLLAELSIGGGKVELFFRKLYAVEAELEQARLGRFKRVFNALHVVGFISTIMLSYVYYGRPFWDPEGSLKALKEKLEPYPDALREQMIGTFRTEAKTALGHAGKVRSPEDLPHLVALYSRCIASWTLVLFAANRKYPVIDKGGRRLVSTFPASPSGYDFRTSSIIRAAAAGDIKGAQAEAERLHEDVVAAALSV